MEGSGGKLGKRRTTNRRPYLHFQMEGMIGIASADVYLYYNVQRLELGKWGPLAILQRTN